MALFFSAGVLGSLGNELLPQDRMGKQKRIRSLRIEVKKNRPCNLRPIGYFLISFLLTIGRSRLRSIFSANPSTALRIYGSNLRPKVMFFNIGYIKEKKVSTNYLLINCTSSTPMSEALFPSGPPCGTK